MSLKSVFEFQVNVQGIPYALKAISQNQNAQLQLLIENNSTVYVFRTFNKNK